MVHVAFIAPRFLENTNRYVRAFAQLDGVTLSVVSADPAEAIPAQLRPRIALDGGIRIRANQFDRAAAFLELHPATGS